VYIYPKAGGYYSLRISAGGYDSAECNTSGVTQGPGSIHAPMAYYHMCLSRKKGHQNIEIMA
jgi:hypothetical protein